MTNPKTVVVTGASGGIGGAATLLCEKADGCPGYAMTLSGTVENITVTIRQLIVNRPDKNRFYSLTYSNYSGEESVYPQSLDYYFSLT